MMTEQVTESHILVPGVEVSFGLLAVPHELAEIIVNANGEGHANHSSWRLYDTAPAGEALIWEGVLSPPFAVAQRLTPEKGIRAGGRLELRCLIDSDQPTVGAVTATLIGYDPSCCPSGDPPNPQLDQPTWFIDAINGHNNRDGKTPANALKTWSEWMRRTACQACDTDSDPISVFSPTGGLLTINILTRLPDGDPPIFRGLMAPGCTAIVDGREIVKASGAVGAVVTKDRALNKPWTATLPGVNSTMLGMYVEVTNGVDTAVGILCRNLGANKFHISEWSLPDIDTDGFVVPSTYVPSPGNTFRVLDYVSVVPGELIIGYNRARMTPFGPPPGGLNLRHLRMRQNTNETNDCFVALPAVISYPDTVSSFSYCIVENGVQANGPATNMVLGNVSMLQGLRHTGGFVFVTQSATRGRTEIQPGAHMLCGEMSCIGTVAGPDADFFIEGVAEMGAINLWDSFEGLVLRAGGNINLGGISLSGEIGFVPLWGKGNGGIIEIFPKSFIQFDQFTISPSTPALPSYEGVNGPGGVVAQLSSGQFDGAPAFTKGFAFDRAAGSFKPLNGADLKWSNLLIPFGAGGFEETNYTDGSGFVSRTATACNPSADSKILWTVGISP